MQDELVQVKLNKLDNSETAIRQHLKSGRSGDVRVDLGVDPDGRAIYIEIRESDKKRTLYYINSESIVTAVLFVHLRDKRKEEKVKEAGK